MLNKGQIDKLKSQGRSISPARTGDEELGPLKSLPGVWKSSGGTGWNMIALPFAPGPFKYRLLLNRYDEELKFTTVDKGVPNRGLPTPPDPDDDQFIVALDYEQSITQIRAVDSPASGLTNPFDGKAIHHEPGFFLHMLNRTTNGLDIARLGTIPHGDSVLALGRWQEIDGPPDIPEISGLPIGVGMCPDIDGPYLEPYKTFSGANAFDGLFDPLIPNELLTRSNAGLSINKTTELHFDTTFETGGIVNIPFVVKQANAADMTATFWIEELDELDAKGNPKLRMQYSQVVMLDFFARRDGMPGLIRWPHVSINTLQKVE